MAEAGEEDAGVLLEIIRAQSEIAKRALDLGGVVSFVAERVRVLTDAGGAIVEMAEGDEMVYRAVSGIAQPQLGMRLKRKGSLSGLCVEQRAMLRCDDSDTDPRVDRDACRKVGLRSMIVVPLEHCDTVVGVLKIASAQPNAFTERHSRILGLMSELIGASMFQAARYETNALYHQATHDALTGLANRALFYDRLRQHLAQARLEQAPIGILNLDMDGLKPINDVHGHRAGDAAIRETADRIRRASRRTDIVARVGGDEFGVILPSVPSRQQALGLAERIAEEIRKPFSFADRPLALEASIGVAVFPEDGGEIDGLIEAADRSMYRVKRTRKARAGGAQDADATPEPSPGPAA
jgi:diguanylate cyclase (GGDEF)-like protein